MKIGARLTFINLAFIAVVAAMGSTSIYQVYTLEHVFNDSRRIAVALRNQVEADMMHDALRADVLHAIKLANENAYDQQKEAIASTKEHAENFQRLISEVETMNISPAVNERLKTLHEPLTKYIKSADSLTKEVFSNPEARTTGYQVFQKDFEYLEGAMEEFSAVIEGEFNEITTAVDAKKSSFMLSL